jgi:hypothetical protein
MRYGYYEDLEHDADFRDSRDVEADEQEEALVDALMDWVDSLDVDDTGIELWADRADMLDLMKDTEVFEHSLKAFGY